MSLYFIQINAICLIVLIIVYTAIRIQRGIFDTKRLTFAILTISAMIMCISDALAWVSNARTDTIVLTYISNALYFLSITACGYFWLTYVNLKIRPVDFNHKRSRLLTGIPLAAIVVLLLANPFTDFLFTIDSNGVYSRGEGIFIHWLVSYGYLIIATVLVIIQLFKAKTRVERSNLWLLVWFIIPPALAAVIQIIFYGTTTTSCGVTISILIIALNKLNYDVSRDPLTSLNNRRALDNYIVDKLSKNNVDFTVLMCDIDNFKSFNDTKGHTVGDLVLTRMATALKIACSKKTLPYFLCRYGGDEFVICGPFKDEGEVLSLVNDLKSSVVNINEISKDPYTFSMSVGYAFGTCLNLEDVEKLIVQADKVMYEDKTRKKQAMLAATKN